MTIRELCALVYVWQLDDLRARVDQQVLAATIARGMGNDVEVPDWDEAREAFDEWLWSEPEPVDPDTVALDRALGLRR